MEQQLDPLEARVQLAEARTDTKFAELIGEMRVSEVRIDRKFSDLESRTDKRFAELVGEMREGFANLNGRLGQLSGRLDHLEKTTYGVKTTIVGTGIAIVAVLVGVLSYGQTWFGLGLSNRETIRAVVAEYASQHPAPLAAPAQGR